MALKFYISVANYHCGFTSVLLTLKARKFLGLISAVGEATGEKLVGEGVHFANPFLNRIILVTLVWLL